MVPGLGPAAKWGSGCRAARDAVFNLKPYQMYIFRNISAVHIWNYPRVSILVVVVEEEEEEDASKL